MKNFLGSLLMTFFIILLAVLFYKGITRLDDLDTYTGKIKEVGVYRHPKSILESKTFFMKLNGMDQIIGVWKPIQNYDYLTRRLSVGDQVTVYYEKIAEVDEINISTHRIEKEGNIIYKLHDFGWYLYVSEFLLIVAFIVLVTALYNLVTEDPVVDSSNYTL